MDTGARIILSMTARGVREKQISSALIMKGIQ